MSAPALLPAAEWAVRRREQKLERDIAHHATRVVVDWFAAATVGSVLRPSTLLRAALEPELGIGPSSLLPDGRRVPTRAAALCNGTAAHAAELDDIFRDGLYHPGAPTVAAALAVAQARSSTGPQLLS
ncbi:MmgE/PrpD family protein, partial [Georgenia sp. 10Sc9-8]|nr:MmgE/PrpD family protein [Georgenia halotolerans]